MVQLLMLAAFLWNVAQQQRPIDQAAFMTGCWERRGNTSVIEEQWLAPRGGVMLGVSRAVRGDSLLEYEFIRLYERGRQLVYAAQPSGQPPAEFVSTSIADGAVTFANSAHDFPQRIIYRLAGDSLHARIEGEIGGQERGVDFRYGRVACGG